MPKNYKRNFWRKQDRSNLIYIKTAFSGNLKIKTKAPQNDFPNFTGIYFSEYPMHFFYYWKSSNNKIQQIWVWMTNVLLMFANEFKKISLQVSTFANEPWKENFIVTDFHQIDQISRNSGKLVPGRFVFSIIDIFEEIFQN